ncbi:MAG: hypothetical protein LBE13_22710 [Bacteroidales bacterium]|jgi:hypothetical protein|nr:hypothetical protein [Bacteroidales bacterium]
MGILLKVLVHQNIGNKNKFNDVFNKIIRQVIDVKIDVVMGKTKNEWLAITFDGKDSQRILGVNDVFVSVDTASGKFHVFSNPTDNQDYFCKTYAEDYMYLINGGNVVAEDLDNYINYTIADNMFNGVELDKQSLTEIVNNTFLFEARPPTQRQELLAKLPADGTFEIIPYNYISKNNPGNRTTYYLIGAKTAQGYQIFNPLDNRLVSSSRDKLSAYRGLSNIGYGEGLIIVPSQDNNTISIKTNMTFSEGFTKFQSVLNSKPVLAATMLLMLVPGGGIVKGLQGASKLVSTINAVGRAANIAAKAMAITFGISAGIDMGMAIANEEADPERIASDIALMTLTLVPAGRGSVGQFVKNLKIGSMAFLTIDSVKAIDDIANSNIPDNEKKEKITTIILTQTFFTLVFIKGLRNADRANAAKAEEMARNPAVIKVLREHGVTPEQVLKMNSEQLKIMTEKVNQRLLTNNADTFAQYLRGLQSDQNIIYRSSGRPVKSGEGYQIGSAEGMQVSKGNKFNIPSDLIINIDPTNQEQNMHSKYLWAIDTDGLKIVRERTAFPMADRGVPSHTNLTGNGKAFSAGEVWFIGENKVRINAASRAYGQGHDSQPLSIYEYQKAIDFWQSLGYEVEIVPLGKR